jgi:hypothetical protein
MAQTETPPPIVTEAQIVSRDWGRGQIPAYSVHEVARVFFAMSNSWIRLKLTPDEEHPGTWFVHEDGSAMVFRRKDPGKPDSARQFLLSDIEVMARSLFRFHSIDGKRLAKILKVVKAQADLYGLLEAPEAAAKAGS